MHLTHLGIVFNFCRPDLIDFGRVRKQSARENLRLAFDIADRVFGVTPLLDPEGRIIFLDYLY